MAIRARGRCKVSARKSIRASFALPSTGGAVRAIFTASSVKTGHSIFAGCGLEPQGEGASVRDVLCEGCVSFCRPEYTAAEDGGADADAGAAFFDGDGEVVGHAHGEFGEVGVGERLVAEAAELAEVGARGFGVFGAHQGGTVMSPRR